LLRFRWMAWREEAVHRLKYSGLRALAAPMGAAMAQHLERHRITLDVIVPVPLHRKRLRERGYNQAALLAREVGEWLGVSVDTNGLARTGYTGPQARTATREERKANVAGAFAARRDYNGLSVAVVDDVTTTRSTLEACAAALREAGANSVVGLTFAREV